MVRNGLYAIAEEMSVIVMRSARSPLLKEAGDLSSALTDAQGRLIAQGRDIPIHMGVMGFTVKEFLKRVPAESLRDGDVWFLNLPEVGGNHLPDVKAVRPVFFEGRLVAFAINLAHWADIGGAVPGSYVPWATECYQEGLRIAPDPALLRRTGPERHAIDFVLSNLRGRDEREGDIFAQFAANDVAARRLHELFAHYGAETVAACFERLHDESEEQMRAALRAAARRRLGGRGLPRRRRHRGPAHPDQGARREAGRRGDVRLHGHRPAGAAVPSTPRTYIACSGGVLRHEGAGRAGGAAQRGLLSARFT